MGRFSPWKIAGLLIGLSAFALLFWGDTPLQHHGKWGSHPAAAAAVTLLMAIWWLTEALPIHYTACLPLLLFPLTGVFDPGQGAGLEQTISAYFDPYIFLFAGGMGIAGAMQQWGLHRRIALNIMRLIGTDPRRLLAGVLASTAFISLWISNSATATMMVSIGMAVIAQLETRLGGRRLHHYGMAIMLGIAYAANVGGIGTKIGTATNAQFCGLMGRIGIEISFLNFMVIGLPFVLLFLPVVWLALWRIGRVDAPRDELGKEAIGDELAQLGSMGSGEKVVLGVFVGTALLWMMGKPLSDLGKEYSVKLTTAHLEALIAMGAALVLLLWRVEGKQALGKMGLRRIPWETLLLLGGSFAMASGIQQSGLSDWLGGQLQVVRDQSPFLQVLLISVSTVALSAVASNVATISVVFNIARGAIAPAYLNTALFAADLSASCDFALPVGTPPNAIVFGSGYVTIPQMARTGVLLDLIAALLSAGWCWIIVDLAL